MKQEEPAIRIQSATWRTFVQGLRLLRAGFPTVRWRELMWMMRKRRETTLLAMQGQRAVGLCQYLIDRDRHVLRLDVLVTAPSARRQGIGSEFLARLEPIAKNLRLSALELVVSPDNMAAKNLYAKHGWEFHAWHKEKECWRKKVDVD